MMKKWIPILGGLLIVQLALALVIHLGSEDYEAFQAQEKLLTFQSEQVDGLRIEGEGQSVLLQKREGEWVLSEEGDFPADQGNVKRLLDKLSGLEKGWPVATTSGAADRFKVAEDDFERHIVLLGGDDSLAELYIGSSPGFRKVHVRPTGDDSIYSVAFNTWEANAKTDDWIDKQILKLDADSVQRIELPDLVLQRNGDHLEPANLGEQEEANAEEIESLLGKLADLRVQSLLGKEAKPEYKQEAPVLEIKLTPNDGDALVYRFSKPDEADYYVVKRSDLDRFFKLPEYTVKPILQATRETLVVSRVEPTPDEAQPEESAAEVAPSIELTE